MPKKKPKKSVHLSSAAPSTPSQYITLAELKAIAVNLSHKLDWDGLIVIGRTPVHGLSESERDFAKEWLLQVKIAGLTQNQTLRVWDLATEDAADLRASLELLAQNAKSFYKYPEFNLYLSSLLYSLEHSVAGFRHLQEGCAEQVSVPWILSLRTHAHRLLSLEDFSEEPLTPEQQALLSTVSPPLAGLGAAYETALASGTLTEVDTALVQVFQLELELLLADSWNHRSIAHKLAAIPGPNVQAIAAARVPGPQFIDRQLLTPADLAFVWDLRSTNGNAYAALLSRHTAAFGCDACEGLRFVLRSVIAEPTEVDGLLAAGVHALVNFKEEAADWFGSSMVVSTANGTQELNFGPRAIELLDIGETLLEVVERLPAHPRAREILCLYAVLFNETADGMQSDEFRITANLPSMVWLCELSLAFEFQAARAVADVAGRAQLLLKALRRSLQTGTPVPYRYFSLNWDDETLPSDEIEPTLTLLSALVPLRDVMDEKATKLWHGVLGGIVSLLLPAEGALRNRLAIIMDRYSEDMVATGHAFQMGYLSQMTGSPELALSYYLICLNEGDNPPKGAVTNAQLLLERSEDLEEAQALTTQLQAVGTKSRHSEAVRALLKTAKARVAEFEKQDQFEKTAVNRWPTITENARKLLGVFSTIERYSSFQELGEYAGMDATWTKRHYDKLVSTGMLFVTDTGYRINPHIAPLLARESQHAIVGRIVRAQGTNAVKQVFNSQREFSIYQVLVQLCPNHLVFPNSSLQSVMKYERMKELVNEADFGYYLRASVDVVVVSSTTYLPMLAIEVDSVWHDTERQQKRDDQKDRLFAAAGIPFLRLRPVGHPSQSTIRVQVAEHLDELVRTLRTDFPGYEQARTLLQDLSNTKLAMLAE